MCEKQLIKQDPVSIKVSDGRERTVHVIASTSVALTSEQALTVSADMRSSDFLPSGSELLKIKTLLPHFRSRCLFF